MNRKQTSLTLRFSYLLKDSGCLPVLALHQISQSLRGRAQLLGRRE